VATGIIGGIVFFAAVTVISTVFLSLIVVMLSTKKSASKGVVDESFNLEHPKNKLVKHA
jgi:UDP-N-acetylmuramyl pentapeptide phosphotransferase/UDP-N-acetylglucosamine-1-phosphate transferase